MPNPSPRADDHVVGRLQLPQLHLRANVSIHHRLSFIAAPSTIQHSIQSTAAARSNAITSVKTAIMTLVPSFSHARPPGRSIVERFLGFTVSVLLLSQWALTVSAMTLKQQLALREDARNMFRHGWESYWAVAFPEDEVGITLASAFQAPQASAEREINCGNAGQTTLVHCAPPRPREPEGHRHERCYGRVFIDGD